MSRLKLQAGSLEALRESFLAEHPGVEIEATYADGVVWYDDLVGVRRKTPWDGKGWGSPVTIEGGSLPKDYLDLKGQAESAVEGLLSGEDVAERVDDIVDRILKGASVGLRPVYNVLGHRIATLSPWRTYYVQNEARIERAVLKTCGARDTIPMQFLFLGGSTPAKQEVVAALVNAARWLDERKGEIDRILIETPAGDVGLAKDLADLQALRIDLANEIADVVYTIRGVEVSEANVKDAALIYDLVARETGRYETMRAFIVRAAQISKAF